MAVPSISQRRCRTAGLALALAGVATLWAGGVALTSCARGAMELRPYQDRIVQEAQSKGNTVVVLPTGAGKTLIAAELIKRLQQRCLFLVPTCLLVEQQARAVREWTGACVGEYMGGAVLPTQFQVLVSTPKAFQIAQGKALNRLLAWESFSLVVFDEVHHVLKEHPYRKLAHSLRKVTSSPPRVLGLTASLTYAVGEKQVEAAIRHLCRDLRIQHMATAGEDELRASGYHSLQAEAEVKTVEVPGVQAVGDTLPVDQRRPHLMHETFFQRINTGSATTAAQRLHAVVRAMEVDAARVDPQFRSPLSKGSLKAWGEYAHRSQVRCPWLYTSLEHWYEALKILVTSWEEAEDAAAVFLEMNRARQSQPQQPWSQGVVQAQAAFWDTLPKTFPRFEHLKDVLLYEHEKLAASPSGAFRGLLFVQQRVTTHVLEHVIGSDPELSQLFRTACLYATSSPATASLAVKASDSQARLRAFSEGKLNLLINTVVAEEGMDVPAANCVIRFDPMINSVSFVQGRGRARQANSSYVVLSEREDRPVAKLAEVEKQQLAIVRGFQPGSAAPDQTQEIQAQRSRERGARDVLVKVGEAALALQEPLATLNLFCKKTKVTLEEDYKQQEGSWVCTLSYSSILRSVSVSSGPMNSDKKGAKRAAATALLRALQGEMSSSP